MPKSAILTAMMLSPDEHPDDVASLKAMVLTSRAENAALARENLCYKSQNERSAHILRVLRRAHFGRSSKRISEDQLNLALDDVRNGLAVENAKAEAANQVIRLEATAKAAPIQGLYRLIPR